MASNPTRKTEVQAYSFEVRRMNSALVRRDPVMLHDPLRTHTRATIVGVILAMVGLLGFLIFGILKPNAKPPDNGGIVIGKESGQIYVYVDKPEMLIPTFNLASARLILKGQQDKAGGEQGQAQQQPQQIQATQPTIVPDDRLKDIRRGRLQGIPGADIMIPGPGQRISDNWAVCHNLPLKPGGVLTDEANFQQASDRQQTAVLAGLPADKLGTALTPKQSVLVERRDRKQFLIYRPAETLNRQTDAVMAEIPPDEAGGKSVRQALKLQNVRPRPMSLGLLRAVEDVDPLVAPVPPDLDAATGFDIGNGQTATVGQVFSVELPDGVDYYVILKDGKQEVSAAVASMILHEHTQADAIPPLQADLLDGIPPTKAPLKVDDYPSEIPEILDPLEYPTTCLGWAPTNEGSEGRMSLYSRRGGLPFPKDKNGIEQRIAVGQANEENIAVDYFYMPPGRGAVVNSATSEASFKTGPIQLVTDRGLRYGIPDLTTAAYLGLQGLRPAPESIIKLLPTGVSLNSQDAERTYDSVPSPPGAGDYKGQDTGQ
jgi:type VII secretion protein EccB